MSGRTDAQAKLLAAALSYGAAQADYTEAFAGFAAASPRPPGDTRCLQYIWPISWAHMVKPALDAMLAARDELHAAARALHATVAASTIPAPAPSAPYRPDDDEVLPYRALPGALSSETGEWPDLPAALSGFVLAHGEVP